jgi:DNA-binding transcriptional LysR family regulator
MSSLTLQQLRVLAAVVEHRSFTRGAQALFMTQSAASQHVRSLEQTLGTPLVERLGGDVVPTRAGAGLVRYAQELLRLVGDAERFVAAVRDGAAGPLVLGACGSAVYLVPALVSAYRAAHGDVEVTLRVAARDALRDAVAGGEVDLGLMSEPVGDARLAEHDLCPDEIVLVAAPASPLLPAAALAPLSAERVAEQALVAPSSPTPSWQMAERAAAARGVALRPALRLDSLEAMKKAVEAGLGVAFLSAWVVEREVALGTLRVVPVDLPLARRFAIVRHATRFADEVAHSFVRFAPEYLARQIPTHVFRTAPPPQVPEMQVA